MGPAAAAAEANGTSNGAAPQKPLNEVLTTLPTTIFSLMTNLAVQHQSVNLGQGFPDDEGPQSMKDVVAKTVTVGANNQYTNFLGIPEARQAVARHSEHFNDLPVDWKTEALLTCGATGALSSAFLGLLNRGDEVILLDPQYDAYAPIVRRVGGVIVTVKLDEEDWSIPREALAAAFSPRTKLIVINTPHNPTGKVFSRSDLEYVASLLIKWDAYAVLDEVYEHLVFKGSQHVSLRSLPGMQERAVRVGSAGKTFSFTGWKIGWVTGPARLVDAVAKAHQFMIFCLPGATQKAIAYGLDHERDFYTGLGESLHKKRQFLEEHLAKIGFKILPAQGTYFLVADFRPLVPHGQKETDVEFATRLTKEAGVTVIPVSAFYISEDKPDHLVRFCFCKTDEKLQKAVSQLEAYFSGNRPGS